MIDSFRDKLQHHTFTPPPQIFPFFPLLFHGSKGEGTQYAQHVLRCTRSFKHSVRMSKGPNRKQRSSCGCLLCIDFFPPYSRDYILRESGVSEMDCGVCIFADRRRRRRRLFLTFQLDALSSWDCITIPSPPCCFSLHVIASER